MITNDERRNVAARLRDTDLREVMFDSEFVDLIEIAIGLRPKQWSYEIVIKALANLIEPDGRHDAGAGESSGPTERGIESIKEWCLGAMEGADGALDAMLCDILGAIEEYEHPELARADTVRSVDRDALLALADEIDRSALELLKTSDLDPNRKRRVMRREHAQDLMAASSRIREALLALADELDCKDCRGFTRDEAMLIAPSLMAIEGVGDAT